MYRQKVRKLQRTHTQTNIFNILKVMVYQICANKGGILFKIPTAALKRILTFQIKYAGRLFNDTSVTSFRSVLFVHSWYHKSCSGFVLCKGICQHSNHLSCPILCVDRGTNQHREDDSQSARTKMALS